MKKPKPSRVAYERVVDSDHDSSSGSSDDERLGQAAARDIEPVNGALDDVASAFAVALHMHQPLIPAGGAELRVVGGQGQ